MMKRLCALMLALMLMMTAASVLAEENAAETATTETATAEPVAEDALLVTINGEEIRQNDAELQFWISYVASQTGGQMDADTVNRTAMQLAMQYKLLGMELEKQGKTMTEEEKTAAEEGAKASWESAVADIMAQEYGIGEDASEEDKTAARADALDFILTNYGYTEESYMAENLAYAHVLWVSQTTSQLAAEGVEATDAEVEEYFNSLVEEGRNLVGDDAAAYEFYAAYQGYDSKYIPAGFRGIIHILLKADEELLKNYQDLSERLAAQTEAAAAQAEPTEEAAAETAAEATEAPAEETAPEATEEPVTQEMVDAARQAVLDSVKEQTDEIKAKLESGTSFEDLIREYGTDDGMKDEAILAKGYPVHANSIMWDPVFQETAMALEKVGDISEPVVSDFGVHILKYLRDIPEGAVEVSEEEKEAMRQDLISQKVNEKVNAQIEQALAESQIIWTEAGEAWKPAEEEPAAEEAAPAEESTETPAAE